MKKFIALTFATLTVFAPFSMHATDADIDVALANLDVRDAVAMIESTNSKIDFSKPITGLEAETEAARQLTAANALAKKKCVSNRCILTRQRRY